MLMMSKVIFYPWAMKIITNAKQCNYNKYYAKGIPTDTPIQYNTDFIDY